jgi:hypothetical protein
MRIWYAAMACGVALVLGACGSGDDGGQPGAEGTVVGQPSGGDDNPTGPDSPEAGGHEASATVVSLPIGGQADFSSGALSTCATVAFNWKGTVPAGVVVEITGLTYPDGVSQDPTASCDGDPCLGDAPSFTADQTNCVLGLAWDGTVPDDETPVITASGKAVCESQDLCDQVQSQANSTDGALTVIFPQPSDSSDSSDSSSESS